MAGNHSGAVRSVVPVHGSGMPGVIRCGNHGASISTGGGGFQAPACAIERRDTSSSHRSRSHRTENTRARVCRCPPPLTIGLRDDLPDVLEYIAESKHGVIGLSNMACITDTSPSGPTGAPP